MGDQDMNASRGRAATMDPLYLLAMLRVGELQCDAMRGREFRRTRITGARHS